MVKQILFILLLVVISSSVSNAATLYMGPSETYTDLASAFAAMSTGDTLVVRNGTYSGSNNDITHIQKPPSGSSGAYTTIKAQEDGGVVFESTTTLISAVSYLQFEGLVFHGDNTDNSVIVGSATPPDHIKFLRCGAYSDGAITTSGRNDAFVATSANDVLFEDCYVWGNFRYAFYAGNNTERLLFRRCIARIDTYNTQTLISAFIAYDTTSVEFQNCIAIDMDTNADNYLMNGVQTIPLAFYVRSTGGLGNAYFRGCMAVNMKSGQPLLAQAGDGSYLFENSVFWDSYNGVRSREGGGAFNHVLSGNVSSSTTSAAAFYAEDGTDTVNNSIAYGAIRGLQATGGNIGDYNFLYNNSTHYSGATAGTHDVTNVNPLASSLRYLPRIEQGSPLYNAGLGGTIVGATILKRIGTDGKMYGEDGYNTTSDTDLWPFPNENLIKSKFASYSFNGITGARGFSANNLQLNGESTVTLTSYIWEYLGSTMPSDFGYIQYHNRGSRLN